MVIGTQALVRPGSPNSSLSADDRATIVPICKAKAVIDCTPNPYDKDALRFKVCFCYSVVRLIKILNNY